MGQNALQVEDDMIAAYLASLQGVSDSSFG